MKKGLEVVKMNLVAVFCLILLLVGHFCRLSQGQSHNNAKKVVEAVKGFEADDVMLDPCQLQSSKNGSSNLGKLSSKFEIIFLLAIAQKEME